MWWEMWCVRCADRYKALKTDDDDAGDDDSGAGRCLCGYLKQKVTLTLRELFAWY